MSELRAPRLSCAEIVDLLTDYLEGALPALPRARVEAHLATCPDCMAYLSQIRTTIALSGRLREEHVAPEVLDELVRAFRDWHAAAG